MSQIIQHHALGDVAARQLANATKTVPQLRTITPRWLLHLLPWVPLEAGIFRLNKVKNPEQVEVALSHRDEAEIPETYVDFEENPREYFLNALTTVVDIHTRVSDLYRSPHEQIKEQLRLTIETVKERQEHELINNPDYGLLASVDPGQRITTLTGAPTPDDLDNLLLKLWKEPAFFLAHPQAIAAFGREATRRGVPPATVSLFGSQFITWRGVPLIPPTRSPSSTARPGSWPCASARPVRAWSGSSNPVWSASRGWGCRSASWGSTATPSPPIWSPCISRSRSSPRTPWRCSTALR